MAQYALVDGILAPVSGLGGRGICHDPRCSWPMIAKPGNGMNVPHWAHTKGSKHALGNGEKGEWHQEVQNLFRLAGAETEVEMPSHDGTRQHRADVVCANGRIIEAQTLFLEPGELASREATYGTMAWLYDAHATHKWFILNDPKDPSRFDWGKPNRRFMSHTKPVFFDTPDGVWQLERMSFRHQAGRKGRPIYEGVRRRVAVDLIDFVTKVTEGEQFGPAPALTAIDIKKKRGTKFRTVQPVEEWLAANAQCDYAPKPDDATYYTWTHDDDFTRVSAALCDQLLRDVDQIGEETLPSGDITQVDAGEGLANCWWDSKQPESPAVTLAPQPVKPPSSPVLAAPEATRQAPPSPPGREQFERSTTTPVQWGSVRAKPLYNLADLPPGPWKACDVCGEIAMTAGGGTCRLTPRCSGKYGTQPYVGVAS